jgi:RNA polymerase sigma-70 factor (ECF subfamily)
VDDAELLRAVGHGDEKAFATLVDRHAPYLFGVAHGLTGGNAADAEDLVQETLLAALNGKFRGESAVRTWLVAILVKKAAMLRRSAGRRGPHLSLAGGASDKSGSREIEVPVRSEASSTEAKLDLTAMLQTLTPGHRAVIVLRELEGMSYEEMAAALGVPRGTVESRLHRAREELRKRYAGYLSST